MRLSAFEQDKYWSPAARTARVSLNGATARGVVMADEERGMVLRFMMDEDGERERCCCGETFMLEICFGRVEITVQHRWH